MSWVTTLIASIFKVWLSFKESVSQTLGKQQATNKTLQKEVKTQDAMAKADINAPTTGKEIDDRLDKGTF